MKILSGQILTTKRSEVMSYLKLAVNRLLLVQNVHVLSQ